MNKCYYRIVWENYPRDKTPLNEQNLNKIDVATDEMDNRIISLDSTKFDKSEAQQLVKYIEYDENTGIFKITHYNGASYTIDTLLEKLAINFDYDYQTQRLIIELSDGTIKYVDLSALITQYEFLDSDTVHFTISADGKVKADIKEGSIQEKHLRPNYLADIKVEVAKAEASAAAAEASKTVAESSAGTASARAEEAATSSENAANSAEEAAASKTAAEISAANAENSATSASDSSSTATNKANAAETSATNAANSASTATAKANAASTSADDSAASAASADAYAKQAQSYAVGTGGVRPNEATDSAKYYYEQSRDISQGLSGALMPMGTVTFSNLPALANAEAGWMYNISDQFTTNSNFKEGAGNVIPSGSNVYKTADGYWDVLSGSPVTGIKGNAESSYHTGNVNLTPANIGAPSNEYMGEHFVADCVSHSGVAIKARGWYRIAKSPLDCYFSCTISLKRGYSYNAPEYQMIQLLDTHEKKKFVSLIAQSSSHIWKKIRLTRNREESMNYIEIYQDTSTGLANDWSISVWDALGIGRGNWRAITPVLTEEAVDGVTVLATLDLPAEFDPSHNIMDTSNNSNLSFSPNKPSMDSADWLGAWDSANRELRAIAPSKVTGVGSAMKATQDGDGNVIKDTYWDKSKSLILAEEVVSSKLSSLGNTNAVEETIQLNIKPGYTAIAAIPGKITSEKICWGSCELAESGGYKTIKMKLRNVTDTALMFYAYVTILYVRIS